MLKVRILRLVQKQKRNGVSLNELALFAGGAGGMLGTQLLGWRTRCAVEIDPPARNMLLRRQRDGFLPTFPVWDNVLTFDGRPWKGTIDVITGGFPCTNISSAGNGEGITGEDSKLFFAMLRIIEEVRPRFVFAENSPDLRTKGLGVVVEGLTRLGYMGRHGVLGAWHLGANQRRNRIWIAAHLAGERLPSALPEWIKKSGGDASNRPGWPSEPDVGRVVHGCPDRVDRIRTLGGMQIPRVAATAWRILNQ